MPVDETKLFKVFRPTITDENRTPTYDEAKDLIWFIDKYASCNISKIEYKKFLRAEPGKTMLDCLTVYDIAFSIFLYESNLPVWRERVGLSNANDESDGSDGNNGPARQIYHVKKGTKLPAFKSGWTTTGRKYYKEIVDIVKGWKADTVFWGTLSKHFCQHEEEHKQLKRINNEEDTGDSDHDQEIELMEFSDGENERDEW